MPLGLRPIGTAPIGSTGRKGGASSTTDAVFFPVTLGFTCDATITRDHGEVDLTVILGFSCDAQQYRNGELVPPRILPTGWVEEAGTTNIWTSELGL